MKSPLLKYDNQIINPELVTGAEYHEMNAQNTHLLGAKSILYVFTVGGREVKFKDQAADVVWEYLCDQALKVDEF